LEAALQLRALAQECPGQHPVLHPVLYAAVLVLSWLLPLTPCRLRSD
jgi:hypothetical protein